MYDCYDKVRLSLSDKTGELRFSYFDIVGVPECSSLAEELRTQLLGRKLADVDVALIQKMACPGDGQCLQTVADIIAEYQGQFLHNRKR
jgi:hypothetical protein